MTADNTDQTTPLYIFVGPEKTGTTTIFNMLPFAAVPRQKETFNLSRHQAVGAEQARINQQAADQAQVFIVEPTYFISDFARRTIAKMQDSFDVHVIHTRRDPVARTVSHYLHHKLKGRVANPTEAVEAYPEIIGASAYDYHTAKWQAEIRKVHIVDIEKVDVGQALANIGIVGLDASVARANEQLAPRSMRLSRVSTLVWGAMIALRLNLLIPNGAKVYLKNRIYYGGKHVSVTEYEREVLSKRLSISHLSTSS